MDINAIVVDLIYGISAVLCAALLTYSLTPPVRVLAFRIGAVDVPTDDRRMHVKPTPRIGGLAIFCGFAVSSLVFGTVTTQLKAVLFGGMLLVILGIIDDVYRLKAWIKFIFQILVAGLAVYMGVIIDHITLFGKLIEFGTFSIPITILWIVGLTNAINLLDGLDGLACGVSVIMSISILGVVLIHGDYASALITAILAGACIGFLPFNTNPAKIFMGDTGSMFLGYTLSVISVQGVFKLHTVISFIVPLAIFALPLLDTIVAFFRRLLHGEQPFTADRKHIHHKLVDLGFTQKEAVRILYAVCGILGLVAITFTEDMFSYLKEVKAIIIAACAMAVFTLNYLLMKKTSTRVLSGLAEHGYDPIKKEDKHTEEKASDGKAQAEESKTSEIAAEDKKDK